MQDQEGEHGMTESLFTRNSRSFGEGELAKVKTVAMRRGMLQSQLLLPSVYFDTFCYSNPGLLRM
jgi:hypothetical protein